MAEYFLIDLLYLKMTGNCWVLTMLCMIHISKTPRSFSLPKLIYLWLSNLKTSISSSSMIQGAFIRIFIYVQVLTPDAYLQVAKKIFYNFAFHGTVYPIKNVKGIFFLFIFGVKSIFVSLMFSFSTHCEGDQPTNIS